MNLYGLVGFDEEHVGGADPLGPRARHHVSRVGPVGHDAIALDDDPGLLIGALLKDDSRHDEARFALPLIGRSRRIPAPGPEGSTKSGLNDMP